MSNGKKCTRCGGQKEYLLKTERFRENILIKCPRCNGTGREPDRTADREAGVFKKPTPEQMRAVAKVIKGEKPKEVKK